VTRERFLALHLQTDHEARRAAAPGSVACCSDETPLEPFPLAPITRASRVRVRSNRTRVGSEACVTLDEVRGLVRVGDEEMLPGEGLFQRPSRIHGVAHVGRVMIHALRLVQATGLVEEMPRLWAAVYLHDLARRSDGVEHLHGAAAYRRLATMPEVRERFVRGGVKESDFPAIGEAVTRHSDGEATPGERYERLIRLLKDADALDRVRIWDLDTRYLRYPQARTMADFATALYKDTRRAALEQPGGYFAFLMESARRLTSPSHPDLAASAETAPEASLSRGA